MTNNKQIKMQAEKHLTEIDKLFYDSLDCAIKYIDNQAWPFIELNHTFNDYMVTLLDDMSRFINDELSLKDAGDCGIISSLLHSYEDLRGIKLAYIDEHQIALRKILADNTEDTADGLTTNVIRSYECGMTIKSLGSGNDKVISIEAIQGSEVRYCKGYATSLVADIMSELGITLDDIAKELY